MNIELDEVVGQDVSDDALEQAAGGDLRLSPTRPSPYCSPTPTWPGVGGC